MGIKHNNKNEPDLYGYEIKHFSNIITLVDKVPTYYYEYDKNLFCKLFGTPKEGINSWSGICAPKYYNKWTDTGQILDIVDNKICIIYNHTKDLRIYKHILPDDLKTGENIIIARWDDLEKYINNKFNCKGTLICHKDKMMFMLKYVYTANLIINIFYKILKKVIYILIVE